MEKKDKKILVFKIPVKDNNYEELNNYHKYLSETLSDDYLFFVIASDKVDITCINPSLLSSDEERQEIIADLRKMEETLNALINEPK